MSVGISSKREQKLISKDSLALPSVTNGRYSICYGEKYRGTFVRSVDVEAPQDCAGWACRLVVISWEGDLRALTGLSVCCHFVLTFKTKNNAIYVSSDSIGGLNWTELIIDYILIKLGINIIL